MSTRVAMTHPASQSDNDSEIMSWDIANLKEYIQTHSEFYVSTINNKPQLQFIALDCTEWTLERISNLPLALRGFLIQKISATQILTNSQIEMYANPLVHQTEQCMDIINVILHALQPLQLEVESADDARSVSTHDSMPSLMSDDKVAASDTQNDEVIPPTQTPNAAHETKNDEVIPPLQTPNAPNETENDEVIPPPQIPNVESMFFMCFINNTTASAAVTFC